ncbi:MAG: hypothetical protein ABEL76_10330 [Bradymonadaceae bacterium]
MITSAIASLNERVVRTATVLLMALGLAASSGCKTSNGNTVPPDRRALDRSIRLVAEGRRRARSASNSLDAYDLRARFNPPRCEAPPFEVYAHGRWNRVFIAAPKKVDRKLQKFRERATGDQAFATLLVRGRFAGRRKADSGRRYRVFRVERIAGK